MGGIGNSSGLNLSRRGCDQAMKMWVANTIENPKRKFWICRNSGVRNVKPDFRQNFLPQNFDISRISSWGFRLYLQPTSSLLDHIHIWGRRRKMMEEERNKTTMEEEGNKNKHGSWVYKRSYNVCMQLYEKELLTENSYLNLKGLRRAGFNGQQLAVVSGLYEWRDVLARAEDESTGYILPNKVILEIAKHMPVTASNLRRLIAERSRLPYVERNHDIVVNIVRHSMQNAEAFEEAALRLKEEHAAFEEAALRLKEEQAASVSNVASVKDGTEAPQSHSSNSKDECAANGSIGIENGTIASTLKENGANVQVLKMPTGACEATLLGNSVSEENGFPDKKGKKDIKVEQIGSSVNLPCHSILGNNAKCTITVDLDSDSDDMM
ncbi:exosome component 10-like protein [Trifolium pratense]|uniref:Exosome component 10-like protein n=1 Tax=Trifolium pratense TaxID=57577 RepID=A0A2K3NQP9_TRIPR|nr:exosome component 10-like protein [Trifolium pratense]